MQLNYDSANVIGSGFIGELDGGAVVFHTAENAEVINCSMNTPAFVSVVSGVAEMSVSPAVQDTATTAGTVDHAHFLKADSSIYSQMTCATSGAEFNFSSLSFNDNETLIIDSLSVTWTATTLT